MQPKANSTLHARRAYQVDEAVAAYRISRTTLYKLMASKTLKSVRFGGRRLIPVEAIEALFAGETRR
jgi:excisionase family DNA binding protein